LAVRGSGGRHVLEIGSGRIRQRYIQDNIVRPYQKGRHFRTSHRRFDPFGRDSLDRHLRQLERVEQELAALTSQIAVHAHQTPAVKLLMTLPGVDFTVAETILAAFGDFSRFPTPDQAASYLGLVPSTRQSGDHCYHGPITKQGARHARWLLVQAAQHAALHPGPIGAFFRRIAKKKNRNAAVEREPWMWYDPRSSLFAHLRSTIRLLQRLARECLARRRSRVRKRECTWRYSSGDVTTAPLFGWKASTCKQQGRHSRRSF
jgi:hypothetical protein